MEVDGGGISPHLQFLHLILVYFLDGGVPELHPELLHELIPVGISISWSGRIVVVLVFFMVMGPPVAGSFGKVGGRKNDHEGRNSSELMSEHLKIGDTVSKEAFHVVMFAFEGFWSLHEDWFDPQEGRFVVGVPVSNGSLSGREPVGRSWNQIMVGVGTIG